MTREMKILGLLLSFGLAISSAGAQTSTDERAAALVAVNSLRTDLPSGARLALITDSTIAVNAYLASELALPTATYADVNDCTAIRECKITQGGFALVVRSVVISGDTANITAITWEDEPLVHHVGRVTFAIKVARSSATAPWTIVSREVLLRS